MVKMNFQSSNGSQIIYTSHDENEQPHIYIINKDGSSSKKLISNAGGQAWLKIQN